MTLTLDNLRSAIYSYLDDDGTRWTAGSSSTALDLATDVDRAISSGVTQAARYYSDNGGDALLLQQEFTTDNSGKIALPTAGEAPLYISNVAVQDANTWSIARATRADEVEYTDIAPRQIRVNFVTAPSFNAGSGDIQWISDSDMEFPDLDILATIYATKNLLPRDAEQNIALNDAQFLAENSAKSIIDTPLAVEFPRYGRSQTTFLRYRWTFIKYDKNTDQKNVIQLHRPLYSFYNVVS
jgi:hypothetical protein